MSPHQIGKAVDISGNGLFGAVAGVIDGAPDEIGFQRLEERLDRSVDAPMLVKQIFGWLLAAILQRKECGRFRGRCSVCRIRTSVTR